MAAIPRRALMGGTVLAGVLALAGCANQTDPTTAVLSLEASYTAALTAELPIIAKGNQAEIAQLKADRLEAAALIEPLASEASAVTLPAGVSLVAADAALAAYAADEAKYGLGGTTP